MPLEVPDHVAASHGRLGLPWPVSDPMAGLDHPLARQASAPLGCSERGDGRLRVDEHLKVIGQSHIYATGDTAWAAVDDLGNHAQMRAIGGTGYLKQL